jgi:hypothetical protein
VATGEADRIRLGIVYHPFFVTTTEYMEAGLRNGVRVGDAICVLYGGKAPFILRPEQSHYTLVGRCFIYELMNGEALAEKEEGKLKEEWFTLR